MSREEVIKRHTHTKSAVTPGLDKAKKNNTSVFDYMGSQNRVGRSFWVFLLIFLEGSSPYGRIFFIICEHFICRFLFIYFFFANNSIKKNRVTLSN